MKTFRQVLEDMNLAPKGKGRAAAKKLYKEKEDKVDEVVGAKIALGLVGGAAMAVGDMAARHLIKKHKARKSAKKKEDIDEISTAQTQQRRRNRKQASLLKTMAKYRAASKAGIHPSRVNQRRTQMTVKK